MGGNKQMIAEVFLKLLLYFIIITIVRIVINNVTKLDERLKIGDEETEYKDKRATAKVFIIVAIVFSVIVIIMGCLLNNVEGAADQTIVVTFLVINVIIYCLGIMHFLWLLKVDAQQIVYRNMFGMKKCLSYGDISYGVLGKRGELKLISEKKCILTVNHIDSYAYLMERLKVNGVIIKTQNTVENFVMSLPDFINITFIVFAVGDLGLVGLCVYTKDIWTTVFFGLIFAGLVWGCFIVSMEKIIVSEEEIKIKGFMKKVKVIPFSQIRYIKKNRNGNLEEYTVCSEQGEEFKFNSLYKNANTFHYLAKKYKWKSK